MYKEPPFMQRSINHAKKTIRVTNSKCMLTPTNLKITVASHVFSHAGACIQIQESMKGGYSMYYI